MNTSVPITQITSDFYEHLWQEGYKPNTEIQPVINMITGNSILDQDCFHSLEVYRVVEHKKTHASGRKWMHNQNNQVVIMQLANNADNNKVKLGFQITESVSDQLTISLYYQTEGGAGTPQIQLIASNLQIPSSDAPSVSLTARKPRNFELSLIRYICYVTTGSTNAKKLNVITSVVLVTYPYDADKTKAILNTNFGLSYFTGELTDKKDFHTFVKYYSLNQGEIANIYLREVQKKLSQDDQIRHDVINGTKEYK